MVSVREKTSVTVLAFAFFFPIFAHFVFKALDDRSSGNRSLNFFGLNHWFRNLLKRVLFGLFGFLGIDLSDALVIAIKASCRLVIISRALLVNRGAISLLLANPSILSFSFLLTRLGLQGGVLLEVLWVKS